MVSFIMTFILHPQLVQDGIEIGNFDLSRLLMINDKAYPWFVLVPRVENVKDAYQLSDIQHQQLTRESRALCNALMTAFVGEKMNVAALGNMVPQLHIHHIIRYVSDPAWPAPIWGVKPLAPMSDEVIVERISRIKGAFGGESVSIAWTPYVV